MNSIPTPAQITQIRNLLIEDINSWLKNKFVQSGLSFKKTEKYEIPEEWLFLASEMRSRYQGAGWLVRVTVEIVRPAGKRSCHLVFSVKEK